MPDVGLSWFVMCMHARTHARMHTHAYTRIHTHINLHLLTPPATDENNKNGNEIQ